MGFGGEVSVSRWMLALAPGRCSTHITGRRQAADGSLANRVRSGTKQPQRVFSPGSLVCLRFLRKRLVDFPEVRAEFEVQAQACERAEH